MRALADFGVRGRALAAVWGVLCLCGALAAQSPEAVQRRDAIERDRVRMERFPVQATAGELRVGAMFTGRTVITGARSVFVRNHLVVEILVEPPHSLGVRVDTAWLQLRVNGETDPRMPQTPELVGYYMRTAQDEQRGRLQASGGIGNAGVVLDTGGQRRGRFPGDPRTPIPRRTPGTSREEVPLTDDPADLDAAVVTGYAFRGGMVHEAMVGYLYFPFDLDLRKVNKLELLIFPNGEDKPPVTLSLKPPR